MLSSIPSARAAASASFDSGEILAVLAVLSAPGSAVLNMTFLADDDRNRHISETQIAEKLRAWWREKSVSDEEWKEFQNDDVHAGGAIVCLMTGIFLTGLMLYTTIAVIVNS